MDAGGRDEAGPDTDAAVVGSSLHPGPGPRTPRPVPTIGEPVLGEPIVLGSPRSGTRPGPVGRVDRPGGPFPRGVEAKLGRYVYLLVDPRTGRPIFVGRGKGDRCYRHLEAARATEKGTEAGTRFSALDRIRDAEVDGRRVRVDILRYGLTATEARLIEATVNDALGLGQTSRLGSQRRPIDELGAALAERARFKRSHPAVLLRVGPSGTATDYGSTRHGWRIGQRWVDTASPRAPRWAVVVAGDLVDEVYRISGWEPSLATEARPGAGRWSFIGAPDAELSARYVGRSVAAYLGTGTPMPVTYVWCGPHWVNTAQ